MDLFEDPLFKTKYQKSKLRVKLWESDFMEKYGKRPSKNDIKEADVTIREAYKMYWKLKTKALEETLMDITFSDDAQANVSANSISTWDLDLEDKTKKDLNPTTTNTENIAPQNVMTLKELNVEPPSVSDSLNVDGAWGDHLNKDKLASSQKKQNLLVGKSSSFQLSQKKFSGTTFTKRNPRKSLSLTKLRSKSDLNVSEIQTQSVDQVTKQNEDGFDASNAIKPIFGETFKVVHKETKITSQPISTIQQLIEGRVTAPDRKLNNGWLDRCLKENNLEPIPINPQRLSGTSDSGVESMESSIHSPNQGVRLSCIGKAAVSDEEDFICNSDSEEERKNKRIRNLRKRLSDEEMCAAKRICIEREVPLSYSGPLPNRTTLEVSPAIITNLTSEIDSIKVHKLIDNINKPTEGTTVETHLDITVVSDSHYTKLDKKNTEVEKCIDTYENENNVNLEPTKPAPRRKARVKNKQQDESDDSDPDYSDEDYKEKKTKSRKSKQSIRKEKKNVDNDEKKPNTRKKAVTARKKLVRKTKITKEEEENGNETDSKDPDIPIYGVETLEVVPRFALPKSGTGDLVSDFTQIISKPNDETKVIAGPSNSKLKLTDREKLEQKVAAGKVNENFVRINLKKKVFVRGKKTMNFSKYKKNQWKQRKKELASSEGSLDLADLAEKNGALTCFKCGSIGHFSRQCTAMKSDDLLPLNEVEDVSDYPTLEEAEKMASQTAIPAHSSKIDRLPEKPSFAHRATEETQQSLREEENIESLLEGIEFTESDNEEQQISVGHKIPEDIIAKLLPPTPNAVEALYSVGPDNSLIETPEEVFAVLERFGHKNFRPGQEKAIMRILSGQSTLVTLSTGSGKSLCYQLPAYIYAQRTRCITLVISPLVSLMDDQVTGVPAFLLAACLHTNQTPKQREKVMDMVRSGQLNILLVSPEAVVAGEKSTGFGALLRQLPPIAFACIDEAHCISQWSHNFRPSYLMICRVLKEKLRVRTILGLTATATKGTAESIVSHLNIHDGLAGIISDTPMPRNLALSVSKDEHRDRALIDLLQSPRFQECDSVIIYCTRREECVRLAGFLRVVLKDQANSDKADAKISCIAEAYHAGLPSYRRKAVQKAFMNGDIRIVAATVAFGMGINKQNLRAVIHYNMPSSFEGYVQEVGRAGRDGLPAHCHLFLDSKDGKDTYELRRHIYANGLDRHMIRRLLQKVFVPCSCNKTANTNKTRCPGHEVAIPVDETVRALDIPEEMILTLLCYLELHPRRFISVLSSVYVMAKISSYNGPKALKLAAQSSPPLAMAIALDLQKGISHENSSMIEFPVVDIAACIGWDSGVAKNHLKQLEWTTGDGRSKRSAISVKFDTLGFRIKAPGDLTDAELDEALEALATRARSQELSRLQQLEIIQSTMNKFSNPSIKYCLEMAEEVTRKSDDIKGIIRDYFKSDNPLCDVDLKLEDKLANESQIISDIRSLISSYRDNNFTGRAVARIFHGIQSPNYTALVWSRCRFWRAHLGANFNLICQIATREILAMR
ncbi:ATP-dependent DNA helicase Q4 [Cephus cinctus]|uniref:DNA 3'-5' helicase n=1 Tax=Cephus cinctus TaxID=211228 RepID=A0AAJ7BH43_CEPCN|nr:ATP-dependent DNA helicase Q4 [Cephus cinctus]